MHIQTAMNEIRRRCNRGNFSHELEGVHADLSKLVYQQAGFFGRDLVAFARLVPGDYHFERGKGQVHTRPTTFADFSLESRPYHNAVVWRPARGGYTISIYYFKRGRWDYADSYDLLTCSCCPQWDCTPQLMAVLGAV